jgi:uncharacterized protein (TIGR04222 family)
VRHSFDDDHEDGWDLSPREVAHLRDGPYGVVLTVLAELHGEGAADLSRPGPVRRLDPPRDLNDRLTIAVYSGLRWFRRPRLLALLPRVRRACAPLRWDLRERRLLPPVRRTLFAVTLRVYAVGLVAAAVLETDFRGSTVVGALAVTAFALLVRGPRRTVAGFRELAEHRAALRRVADDHHDEAAYLCDIVAAHGLGALRVLCAGYVAAGALAPPRPSYEPRPVPVPVLRIAPAPTRPRLVIVVPPSIFVPVEPPEPAVLRRDRMAVAA